ncbi:MAG: hypothetical protein A2156_03770 [Deltaproteobacteria bacterium RBG_16_48_10]|nr:MAG: hypothetical protein A2156_03770 [Deltaproteobacteria bacterium RBG_16_48_10]
MNHFFIRSLLSLLTLIALTLNQDLSFAFRDLGTPVREAVCWGAYAGPGKTGNRDTIYLSFGQYNAPLFLLAVNPDTGNIRQFNGPLSSGMGSWGFTVDHENRIYLGSYYNAHLLRFDPKTEKWEDLGRLGEERDTFICSLTTAPDGKIWGGTYPSANLFYYDPKTKESENFGRMDPDQFYCYPTAGEDGLIYCAIGFEKMDIVVFDPKEKKKSSLIPLEERKAGRLSLIKGKDGKVYAKLPPQDSWFRIEGGKKLISVSQSNIPFPEKTLPDGRQFSLTNNKILKIQNAVTGEEQEIPLKYEASGSCIFVVGTGPDSRIYGSSMLPLRLFVYDPEKNVHKDLGKATLASGEVYSMGSLDGKLYLCSYPEGRISVYDPQKPLQFGDQEDSNPRELGPMGESLYRPRTMVAGPHGRVYIGGYPDYGLIGGGLGVYDPKNNEKRIYRHLIRNQSIVSLAYLEKLDLIAAGSSIRGGTGTHAIEKEAKLILWDPKKEEKIFEITPVSDSKTILSLAVTDDQILYGITENEKVFVLDAEKREIKKVFDLGFRNPREISLQPGPDGKLYGLAKEAIFVIDPKNDHLSFLANPPTPIDSGMALLGRKIYYGSGANLWEFEIPSEPAPLKPDE